MSEKKAYYFASDFHLGIPTKASSRKREDKIVRWLDMVAKDAAGIYLLGDIFDFWFEYKHVVPKGYIRLLGKLAQLKDSGIEITIFKGNHDMWMFGYLEDELDITIISNELEIDLFEKKIFMHHGDGLGSGDYLYKIMRSFFRNRVCQVAFAFLHPYIGMGIGQYLSSKSRLAKGKNDSIYNEKSEWLLQYCKEKVKEQPYDYLIFGHRHLPLDIQFSNASRYINLGEWLHYFSYARLDINGISLEKFEN